MKKIISVVGARPNFIKIAPIHKAFLKYQDCIQHLICHTGQHFDRKMSSIFFDELEIPKPDFSLGIGGGSHAEQTARIMMAFEKILLQEEPDLVIVPGDVNSTLAASLTAAKLHIPVAHIEAGLRSFDRDMPEEINRVLTDEISDLLFVTEKSGMENLLNEGVRESRIFFTGNVMIDSLVQYLPKIERSGILSALDVKKQEYVLSTFHRPSNVDHPDRLKKILENMKRLAVTLPVIFPIHPRTRNNIKQFGLEGILPENVILLDPIGYIDFLALTKEAALVLTDSGGIQEETTFMGVPCITVRNNTERPVTCDVGTNYLAGQDYAKAIDKAFEILNGNRKKGEIPERWDGKAAPRIVKIVAEYLKAKT
ncbi:MAG: UDP-N-acetyl glucosamine 2-epimerase [bacterium]|nr:MAG: UDP-N-acetyl glucosamine 2-epimerase [bacterium]